MEELITLTAGKTRVYVESWRGYKWSKLEEISDFDRAYFGDRVNFRIQSGSYLGHLYAVKVEITGRSHQVKHGELMVKGKITWAKDDPSEKIECSPCWLTVN